MHDLVNLYLYKIICCVDERFSRYPFVIIRVVFATLHNWKIKAFGKDCSKKDNIIIGTSMPLMVTFLKNN